MPTVHAESPVSPRLLAALLLLGGVMLGGCAADSDPPSTTPAAPRHSSSVDRPAVEAEPVPADLSRAFTRLLDRRAQAVRDHDRHAFTAVLDDDPAFVTTQQDYYDNLVQLPIATFGYTLDRATLVRSGDDYRVVVDVALELDGFDAAPVHTPDRFRFSSPPSGRGYRLSSVTDADWERANGIHGQPWDTQPIQVRRAPGVLAVFDDESVRAAKPIVRSVEKGITEVRGVVPYPEWSGTAVVYALSDTDFQEGLENVPGGDPQTLDGVTFTLPVSASDKRIAATRFVLAPDLLDAGDVARGRLVRHELTHVAVGEHDDLAPLWLSEGIAEWVSVDPLAPRQRQVEPDALAAAEAGIERMPVDASFNDDHAATHYGISWWVVQYLADTFGEGAPWTILDQLNKPHAHPGETTKYMLHLSTRQLARRGAALLVTTYDPDFHATEDPTPTDGVSLTPGPG